MSEPSELPSNLADRFWPRVEKTDDCWLWTGAMRNDGYGNVYVGGGRSNTFHMAAHRVAFLLVFGTIPDGLHLDHECHNVDLSCVGGYSCPHRRCVNPAHLFPRTNRENHARGRQVDQGAPQKNRAKTHCAQGHEFTEANTYYRKDRPGRVCLECSRIRKRERYHRLVGH